MKKFRVEFMVVILNGRYGKRFNLKYTTIENAK